ncbi:hypothetical protein [Lyngbya aestuarii]|uniref:hypothetical protein n=1 Tax=Lyngbya aestuarii TaxID=118322 RepID=UPI00403E234E
MTTVKRIFYGIFVVLLTILVSQSMAKAQVQGCSQSGHPVTTGGNQFPLRVDESLFLEPASLEIKLLNIEDSRCPSDVQCIWAGQVTATISVISDGQSLGVFPLTLKAGQEDLAVANVEGHSIQLINVVPYPMSTQSKETLHYIATLAVSQI